MSEQDIERLSGQFVVSAGHSHPETLADGRTVAPGETVERVPAADERLVEEGTLISIPEPKPVTKKKEDDNG